MVGGEVGTAYIRIELQPYPVEQRRMVGFMITVQFIISFLYCLVHHDSGGLFRIVAYIRFRVFEIGIEVHFIIGVRCEQKYHFVSAFYDKAVVFSFQSSSFVDSFDSEGKLHTVVIEYSGIYQSVFSVCPEVTFCFAVGAIAQYKVLFSGLVGGEFHYHDAVRIGNEIFPLILHSIFIELHHNHGRI